jgi:predicted phage terminase large subunit-like protein
MLRESRRFNVACCGRRFGKTKFGIDLISARAPFSAVHGYPVAWFAPTYKYLTEVWSEANQILRPLVAKTNKQDRRIELKTGGVVEFWTLDGEDPARGRKYGRIVIDEAAIVRGLRGKWEESIRPTLTDYRGEAWLFSTPKGRNDFSAFYDEAEAKSSWARWQLPTAANPFIDPDEIDEARRDLPELVFRQEYLAEFVDFTGTVVRREWLQTREAPPLLRIAMGVDLAISTKATADWTAAAVLGLDSNGKVWVLDVARIRGTFNEVLRFIADMARKWDPKAIAIEKVQYQAAVVQELLRTTTLPVRGVTPDKDKYTRFIPMASRYEEGLVIHNTGLPDYFLEELLAFNVGDFDDQIDAMSLAHEALGWTSNKPAAAWGATRRLTA